MRLFSRFVLVFIIQTLGSLAMASASLAAIYDFSFTSSSPGNASISGATLTVDDSTNKITAFSGGILQWNGSNPFFTTSVNSLTTSNLTYVGSNSASPFWSPDATPFEFTTTNSNVFKFLNIAGSSYLQNTATPGTLEGGSFNIIQAPEINSSVIPKGALLLVCIYIITRRQKHEVHKA